ncbi:PREDICTED: retrotransposon unclassified [Prunus dulcis]|uniref:PREDICTED: retrotransposon unclassified n=1 Tax=Prunus dulcis TaxID=3755 RepID=A0A5E4GI95_PRUDU|nr:hypothetical protein L3X38_025701 [Prunus dulcis]VVA39577.1 PREDICTED: retrotransposon unclassified [Prunus dulcis]
MVAVFTAASCRKQHSMCFATTLLPAAAGLARLWVAYVIWRGCHRSRIRLLEYLQVNRPGGTPCSNQDQVQRWTKPPMRHLKINVDGAWNTTTKSGGVGVVIRDSAGAFIAGRARKFDNVFSALQSEALAAREGVVLAITREGFAHVRRTTNEAAHLIARFALHLGTPISWFEEPPDFLVDVLFEDFKLVRLLS